MRGFSFTRPEAGRVEWNGTGLGRRRPKLKKGRIPNTQISPHPTTFEAVGPKSQKTPSAEGARKKLHSEHLKEIPLSTQSGLLLALYRLCLGEQKHGGEIGLRHMYTLVEVTE